MRRCLAAHIAPADRITAHEAHALLETLLALPRNGCVDAGVDVGGARVTCVDSLPLPVSVGAAVAVAAAAASASTLCAARADSLQSRTPAMITIAPRQVAHMSARPCKDSPPLLLPPCMSYQCDAQPVSLSFSTSVDVVPAVESQSGRLMPLIQLPLRLPKKPTRPPPMLGPRLAALRVPATGTDCDIKDAFAHVAAASGPRGLPSSPNTRLQSASHLSPPSALSTTTVSSSTFLSQEASHLTCLPVVTEHLCSPYQHAHAGRLMLAPQTNNVFSLRFEELLLEPRSAAVSLSFKRPTRSPPVLGADIAAVTPKSRCTNEAIALDEA
jgi:hypothetical protein